MRLRSGFKMLTTEPGMGRFRKRARNENDNTSGWRQETGEVPSFLASRGVATRHSRVHALPSLNLKKKSLLQAKKTWQSRSCFARTVLSSLLFFLLYRSSSYPLKPKLYGRIKLSGRFLGWRTRPIYALQTNHHAKFIYFFKSWPLISTYFNVKSHNTNCNKKILSLLLDITI